MVSYVRSTCRRSSALQMTDCLNDTYPERWEGTGGSTACPPRSRDLTSFDYNFRGHKKISVYYERANQRDALLRDISMLQKI
jgi:hypothetical protein